MLDIRKVWALLAAAGILIAARGSAWSAPDAEFILQTNGWVVCSVALGSSNAHSATFQLTFPNMAPQQSALREGVLRMVWLTNGMTYTETVLVQNLEHDSRLAGRAGSAHVLVVNIEGENTNPSYAEGQMTLSIAIGGKRQNLQLRGGVLTRIQQTETNLLAALDIPESGIKLSEGTTLEFSGNIPPSLKGSMTLKIPLAGAAVSEDRLLELSFDECLRQATKSKF